VLLLLILSSVKSMQLTYFNKITFFSLQALSNLTAFHIQLQVSRYFMVLPFLKPQLLDLCIAKQSRLSFLKIIFLVLIVVERSLKR